MPASGADRRKLKFILVPALALALVGLWLAALAGAENQPTVRQGAYGPPSGQTWPFGPNKPPTCDDNSQIYDTTITKAPKKETPKAKAKFEFVAFLCRGPGTYVAQDSYEFTCKLDKGKNKSCESPTSYRGLKKGKHKFSVSVDETFAGAGNGDPTPAKHKWKIVP